MPIVAKGSVWYYSDASDSIPPANWKEPEFDDGNWRSGPAQLGYENGETTPLKLGPKGNEQMTFYFRHRFTCRHQDADFPHPAMILQLVRDDGAVIYLNGNACVGLNKYDEAGKKRTRIGWSYDTSTTEYLVE